ncbi:MAG TPA: uroporphyrinogen-III synthase [Novosphingobium sp.]|nr:uroporphyrinogen-III synthase [Novosphingobium sp.]
MSTLPLVVVRPEPGNAATVAAARALGLEARAVPLFEIEPVAWRPPDPATFDSLLLGSANALLHAGDDLARYRALPVYAVGPRTAAASREAGFTVAAEGRAGLDSLVAALRRDGRRCALRLAGERHVVIEPDGIEIETVVVYAVRPLALDAAAAGLSEACIVALHSAEAARHFARECDRLRVARGKLALACLAPGVAVAAGDGWRASRSATRPDDPALLALSREMCQTPPGVAENSTG